MTTPNRAHSATGAWLGELDRYLVPLSERRVLDYLAGRLFVGRGLRERLLRAMLNSRWAPAVRGMLFHRAWYATANPFRLQPKGPVAKEGEREPWQQAVGLLRVLEEAPEVLDAAGLQPLFAAGSILLRDYDAAGRGRRIVFGFRPGASEPSAVVKLREPGGTGLSLRHEYEALLRVRAHPELAGTVPESLAYRRTERAEILAVSVLPGTSAYVEMQTMLRPRWRVGVHFEAAAEWLATFHLAVDQGYVGADGPDKDRRTWRHGDFWARNFLLRPLPGGGTGVAVVDWEHFSASGTPLQDLFHFPITYGLNYPWRAYRRLPPVEAFRLTFLEASGIGAHVRAYFRRYCTLTGFRAERLRRALTVYLEDRARTVAPGEAVIWHGCAQALQSSSRTVLEP